MFSKIIIIHSNFFFSSLLQCCHALLWYSEKECGRLCVFLLLLLLFVFHIKMKKSDITWAVIHNYFASTKQILLLLFSLLLRLIDSVVFHATKRLHGRIGVLYCDNCGCSVVVCTHRIAPWVILLNWSGENNYNVRHGGKAISKQNH